MGLFDDIVYEMPCPICGEVVRNFQSKDGGKSMRTLTPAQLWENSQALAKIYDMPKLPTFYSNCENCATWSEVTLRPGHRGYGKDQVRGPLLDKAVNTDETPTEGVGSQE